MDQWEPREFTRYEYDENGRLVGAVTMREPEFSPAEVDAFLAHMALEREPRGPHGIPLAKATAKGAKFETEKMPTTDLAALQLHLDQEAFYKKNPEMEKQRATHLWSVREVTDDAP